MSTHDEIPVTVIGLGPMGQAMVRLLMKGGHPVTVWNRTAARADALVAEGATRAPSPADAVAAADLVILSLTDYQAMDDILGPVGDTGGDRLAGKVLANLSSDTPDRTRAAATWAAERGASLLTGGVMVPAEMLGGDGAYAYYSGPEEVFRANEPVLRLLGDARYVGADPGLAQLYYQAQLDIFLTTLSGLLHATALVGSAGVTAAEFLPEAIRTIVDTPAMIGPTDEVARRLDAGDHLGDLASVTMMGATAGHILGSSEAAGIDLALPRAVRSHYDSAIAAGHGGDSWTSLFEVVKRPREAAG